MTDGPLDTSNSRRHRRRLPWGFVGMVGLVWGIESQLARHDLDFTAPWHWDWRDTGKAATRADRVLDKQILCFGDSLLKFGLIPGVIRQATQRSTYNLALHTGQAASSYFLLRRALDAGARPSAIVFDATPHMFMQSPRENPAIWPELLTIGECLDLGSTSREPDFLASVLLSRSLPTIRERHEIRASVMGCLRGKPSTMRYEVLSHRRNWRVNEGAQLLVDRGAPRINPVEWVTKLYTKWLPDPTNCTYLERFLTLAASREITVYWLLPPVHPDVQAGTDRNGFDRDYSSFVESIQARFANLVVVDARHSGFDRDDFDDGAHVNRRGALKLSSALAEVLREPGAARPRTQWRSLDLARSHQFAVPVEDIRESTLALKTLANGTSRH